MGMIEKMIGQTCLQYKQILQAMENEELKLPRGRLIFRKAKGKQYCYLQYKDGEAICNQRIQEEELEEIKKRLARRDTIKKEVKVLRRFLACNEKEFPQMPEPKQRKKKTMAAMDATPEKPYATLKGDFVRSKSEAIIANELYMAQIPYAYEKILLLPGYSHEFLPDFTIYTPKQNKMILWEHCGLIDKEEYRTKWNRKKQVYENNGISEWNKNLIVTYESATEPLDILAIRTHVEVLQEQ